MGSSLVAAVHKEGGAGDASHRIQEIKQRQKNKRYLILTEILSPIEEQEGEDNNG